MDGWRVSLAVMALLTAACGPHPPDLAPATRLHHAHLEVADPGVEMDILARAHDCTKLILPGTGVGVRCGDSFVLFERRRADTERPTRPARLDVTGRGDTARVTVTVVTTDAAADTDWVRTSYGPAVSDHVRFDAPGDSTPGGSPVSLLHVGIGWRGVPPESLTTSPGGVPFEHVHDVPPGPDAFWCPMHPDVRSSAAGACPLCGMPLVAMPDPAVHDYFLDVSFAPAGARRGRLHLGVHETGSRRPVVAFTPTHERLFHLFLISRRLDVFQHLHPELRADGRFALDVELPQDDAYMIVADVHPSGGTPQMLQVLWATPGFRGSPFPDGSSLAEDRSARAAGDMRVSIDGGTLVPGTESALEFSIADARSGRPVTDLEPYLGAPGHLVIASADLGDIVHSHPADVLSRGPDVRFEATFPRPGLYKMWLQVQRAGRVETAPFVVAVK